MKTTLDLNDALVANAKVMAARERTTLTRIVEEGLRLRLQRAAVREPARGTPFPVVRGRGGLRAGIDPRSNRSLLEAAESDDA